MTGNEDKDGEQQEIGEEGGETNRQGEKEKGGGGFYYYSHFVLLSALQSRFQHHLTTRLSDGEKRVWVYSRLSNRPLYMQIRPLNAKTAICAGNQDRKKCI